MKESKNTTKGYSPAFAYRVPGHDKPIKVERVQHRTYVANLTGIPERFALSEMHEDQWKCIGKWESLNENL
jgi:hypothetical protein